MIVVVMPYRLACFINYLLGVHSDASIAGVYQLDIDSINLAECENPSQKHQKTGIL